jgi:hypothetical protein
MVSPAILGNIVLVEKVLSDRGWSEVKEVVSERKEKCDR